ncbi:TPA: hypothetical protein P2R00_003606 [Aeromonas veronii]|nr:hypothetical protein [Aeromonas veronii]
MADFRGSTTPIDTRDLTQTPMFLFRALDREFHFALDAAALPETALCQHALMRSVWIGVTSSAPFCVPPGLGSTHPIPISVHGEIKPSSSNIRGPVPPCWYRRTPALNGTPGIWPARFATSRVTTMNMENGVMAGSISSTRQPAKK